MTQNIAGIIHRVTYHNTDNGFCVLKVTAEQHQEPITVVGKTLTVNEGESLVAEGKWIEDPSHGSQFKANKLTITPPNTEQGMLRYLSAGIVEGIGKEFAKRLIDAFGDQVFHIIENEPEKLRTVPGIGKKKYDSIVNSWSSHHAMRDAMVFLQNHDIGPQRAANIYRQYKDRTIEIIRENPYQLYRDIRGIGFKTADKLGRSIGVEPTSILRAQAGIIYSLETMAEQGHCACELNTFIEDASNELNIPQDIITTAIEKEKSAKRIVTETVGHETWIYQSRLFYGELGVAQLLRRLQKGPSGIPSIDAEKAISWVQKKTKIELASSQKEAITRALTSKVFVITGGPGVGKTTLVNSIVQILSAKKMNIALAAPTGRAAKRMQETTGLEAKTIHRLLEYDPSNARFQRDMTTPLKNDVIIIDEVSMVDVVLMFFLLKAIPENAVLILVGDVDQLPSVGPGKVLEDIIESDAIPVVKLTEIYRQAAQSLIVTNAHLINQGKMPTCDNEDNSDFYFIEAEDSESIVSTLVKVVSERIPQRFGLKPLKEIQILTPMNHTPIGAIALNTKLQDKLNQRPGEIIETKQGKFKLYDKIMQLENNYDKEVFNGDIGFIKLINPSEQKVLIEFEQRIVEYAYTELNQISLAYACTIHKSQGSEYPAVIIPIHTQHAIMLQKKLIYTAVTRSKRLVVLIGTKKALRFAVEHGGKTNRLTALKQRLNGSLPDPPPDMFEKAQEEF